MRNKIIKMAIALCIMGWCTIPSCGVFKKVAVETKTEVKYIDSLVVTYKDSTIFVEVPKEVVKDVVPQYDTLKMETSVAKSISYVDTLTHTLKGQLENKPDATIGKVVYLPSEEHIVYRDSIVTKEVPVKVEVEKVKYPRSYWWLLAFFGACIVGAGYSVYRKLR